MTRTSRYQSNPGVQTETRDVIFSSKDSMIRTSESIAREADTQRTHTGIMWQVALMN